MGTREIINKGAPFHLGYRPALDGLRGLAILLVLLTHLRALPVLYGPIGVNLFFVLSGFLITCLLVEEWDQTGGISLKAFYSRRALRLLPALIAMLVAFLAYSHFCHAPEIRTEDLREAFCALFYCMNWAIALDRLRPVFLQHTWSLSIEEQFYLVWAVLLWLLLRRSTRKSLLGFLLLMAGLAWLNRELAGRHYTDWRIACGLDTRADALLIGCAIGVAMSSALLPPWRRLQPVLFWGAAASFAGLGLMGALLKPHDAALKYTGLFFISVFAGVIILDLNISPRGFWGRALGCAPMVWLGRLSYSLYLWHYPIILALNETKFSLANGYWCIHVAAVLGASAASYYLIERPFLRLKRRFQIAK